ncbi:hypothetical protein [Lacticaseibacillus saniviri]|uniref:Uncharacterized protein n=1 Tax=Lacticaseibacillus saniviri JCM 17471 = DSM 24301 TaxID=1293598 RepID=A0A0R2MXY4_9LACO|nr:hypothetical protein [Lacticaseibacillus saniviri]KRO16685.1 hypothetical protein IV56_GL000959 [Lacticaseibacillus saniviri JCM 17471 = DSM 24301]MCG4282342.1 hypothetical protein [Lacticaseibacillus saniviri]
MLGFITLILFLGAGIIFILGLLCWLVMMTLDKNPKWARRVTLTSFLIAIVALVANALR